VPKFRSQSPEYRLFFGIYVRSQEVVIYEPALEDEYFFNSKVIKDIEEFKKVSDVIVANRIEDTIRDVKEKVYTRDIFESDS